MKTALALVGALLLAACQSSTAPDDCPEIRAQVATLRAQAAVFEQVAASVRTLPGGDGAFRAYLELAAANRATADRVAVPRCAPYEVAP